MLDASLSDDLTMAANHSPTYSTRTSEGCRNSEAAVAQRKFIYSVKDSSIDERVDSIQHYLSILASAEDEHLFKPDNPVTNQFYVSLSKLLSSVDRRSYLAWSAVDVLQVAVSSSRGALHAVSKAYDFIPALSNLMHGSLTADKKLRLLRILKDLTYGIKIHRQEAYLPPLLRNLCDWSQSEDSTALHVSHALRVLVNLLHGNDIVRYTFMRYIDPKQFCRRLLKVKCIEAYQLLILLHDVSHEKPDSDLHKFVEILFPTLIQNCSENNIAAMHHSVDFLSDIVEKAELRPGLTSFTGYSAIVDDVIQFLKNVTEEQPVECVGLLFKFLGALIRLQIPSLIPTYPLISKQCFEWVSLRKKGCPEIFTVLQSVLSYFSQGDESVNVDQEIVDGLTQFILPLLNETEQTSLLGNSEDYTLITSLLMLLDEALKIPQLRAIMGENLEPKVIQSLVEPLFREMEHTYVSYPSVCEDNSTHSSKVIVCVQLLYFISNLLSCEPVWITLYSSLIREQAVLYLLSIALSTGTYDMRRKVLAITGTFHFPGESVNILAKCLMESGAPHTNVPKNSTGFVVESNLPSFKFSKQRDLDELITRLQELNENNKLESVSAHELIEVMEFKEMMSAEVEEVLQNSLIAARNEIDCYKKRCSVSQAKLACLQKQLYCAHKSLEQTRSDLASLSTTVTKMRNEAQEVYEKNCLEVKEYQANLNTLTNDMTTLRKINEDRNQIIIDQKLMSAQMSAQIKELKGQLDHVRNELSDVEKENQKLNQDNKDLRNEVAELELVSKRQLQTISHHEEQQASLEAKLQELQRIRDTIYEVAGGKKKF